MANKTKQKRKVVINRKTTKQKQVARRAATPFGDAGAIAGNALGQMFNLPFLKGAGRFLGSGIGSIFGSGDYTLTGAAPEYNVLTNSKQIPQFSTTHATNLVCHREYLGDIVGTAAFTNRSYPLNPGNSKTFPWLSTIAQNYQQYKIHGIIFEFRPLITDFVTSGAPGVVVMATNYNANAESYDTKQEMENSEFAVSVKPTGALMHGVECAKGETVLSQLYVRTGAPPANQDLRLYDIGTFQFASQNNPIQVLGELWVSYCVEFFKPILPDDVGGNVLSARVSRSGVTATDHLGTATTLTSGDLEITFLSSTTFKFKVNPGNKYMVMLGWAGTVANPNMPGLSFTGGVVSTPTSGYYPSNSPASATNVLYYAIVKTDSDATELTVHTTGSLIVLPTAVDITVTQYDSSD
nr:structural protein [Tolivirales sp.]